jgi:hypothetical protein
MATKKVLLIAASGWALMALVAGCEPDQKPIEREFVCYTDGVLTERHVGVLSVAVQTKTVRVTIRYVDGQKANYYPEPGSTCQVEVVR